MAIAYLSWSGDVKTKRSGRPSSKRQVWTVTDAATEDEAYAAAGLPDIDAELSPGSEYRVSNLRAYHGSNHGPFTWAIDVDYDIPPDGTFDPYGDPRNRPAELTWGQSYRTVPMEMDVTGKLVKNSAGNFFDPLPTRNIPIDTLRVTKWFTSYDRSLARTLTGKVNSAGFTVGGTAVLPYEALCVSILPTSSYTTKARYVQVAFDFEIATDIRSTLAPDQSGFPFDAHLVDKGRRGWYDDGGVKKQGFFCMTQGSGGSERVVRILSEDVLLDGTGKPVDPAIMVADADDATGSTKHTPVANPHTDGSSTITEHMTPDYESPFSVATPTVNRPKIWLFAATGEADFSVLPFSGPGF